MPYGYLLTNAGPHPTGAWPGAASGCGGSTRTAAPIVRWMFTMRLQEMSLAGTTRALNAKAIPCPSAEDPESNPHRTGAAWTLGTMREIPLNPADTGRMVWNRTRTDRDLADPGNTGLGRVEVRRRNTPAHPGGVGAAARRGHLGPAVPDHAAAPQTRTRPRSTRAPGHRGRHRLSVPSLTSPPTIRGIPMGCGAQASSTSPRASTVTGTQTRRRSRAEISSAEAYSSGRQHHQRDHIRGHMHSRHLGDERDRDPGRHQQRRRRDAPAAREGGHGSAQHYQEQHDSYRVQHRCSP